MLLEPCHRPHDVLYIILAPENDYVLTQSSAFFQQLSVTYEQCRLGRHRPLSDKLRDSVMRVGRINAQKVADEPLDDWFHNIGMSGRLVIRTLQKDLRNAKTLSPALEMIVLGTAEQKRCTTHSQGCISQQL